MGIATLEDNLTVFYKVNIGLLKNTSIPLQVFTQVIVECTSTQKSPCECLSHFTNNHQNKATQMSFGGLMMINCSASIQWVIIQ